MMKLKLGPIADDKPVKVAIEFPAAVYRNLQAYAALLARTGSDEATGEPPDPAKLIVPMVERFMATDRAFAKARRSLPAQS